MAKRYRTDRYLGDAMLTGTVLTQFTADTFQHPRRMWGNPTIPGTRIPLFRVQELLTEGGFTVEELCEDVYPHLNQQQVVQALREYGIDFQTTEERRTVAANLGTDTDVEEAGEFEAA